MAISQCGVYRACSRASETMPPSYKEGKKEIDKVYFTHTFNSIYLKRLLPSHTPYLKKNGANRLTGFHTR